jgi:hypothetical protein
LTTQKVYEEADYQPPNYLGHFSGRRQQCPPLRADVTDMPARGQFRHAQKLEPSASSRRVSLTISTIS